MGWFSLIGLPRGIGGVAPDVAKRGGCLTWWRSTGSCAGLDPCLPTGDNRLFLPLRVVGGRGVVLGGFMRGAAPTAGWVLVGFGSLAALVGVLMIWLRSRRPD